MHIPTHPAGTDDPTSPSRRGRRIAIAAALLVIVLASLHLLNTTVG